MAFDIAGLGGSFAAGVLGGAQSAQKERERLANERETRYLQTYTQLLQSGEWEPVDVARGVRDGGVLQVGGIGFLKKKAQQPDYEKELKLRNLESQIVSRGVKQNPYKGEKSTRDVSVPGPEGKGEVPAKQPIEWDGEKWVDVGKPVIVSKPPAVGWKTFMDPKTKEIKHLPSNVEPPPNMVPTSTYVAGERLELAQGESVSKAYTEKANQAEQVMRANAMANNLPPAEEGVIANKQKEYERAFVDYGGHVAGAEGARQGLTGRQLEMAVEMGRRAAKKKYDEQRATPPEEVKSWVDKVLEQYKAFFGSTETPVADEQQRGPMVRGKIPPRIKERVMVRQKMPPRPPVK